VGVLDLEITLSASKDVAELFLEILCFFFLFKHVPFARFLLWTKMSKLGII
jgi:hypothetical protein